MAVLSYKRLVIACAVPAVVVLAGVLGWQYLREMPPADGDTAPPAGSEDPAGSTITDYAVPGIDDIVGGDAGDEAKAWELYNSGRLKLSVGRDDDATAYFTAVLDLDDATLRQNALYELVLIARRRGDSAAETEYAAALGAQQLAEFDDPPLPSEARQGAAR